jgi:hypothetical protein
MPKITSLNVDVRWSPEEEVDDTPNENSPLGSEFDPDDDLVPSNRLAVNSPLSVMNKQRSYARPVGRIPIWALDGGSLGPIASLTLSNGDKDPVGDKERIAQIMQIEFYAGRAFGNWRRIPVWGIINPAAVAQLARLRRYAFGALPVKSQGDVIGHPLEGLIGEITVVPEDAKITDIRAPKHRFGMSRFGCFRLDQLTLESRENKLPIPERLRSPTNDRYCTDSVIVPDIRNHDRPVDDAGAGRQRPHHSPIYPVLAGWAEPDRSANAG